LKSENERLVLSFLEASITELPDSNISTASLRLILFSYKAFPIIAPWIPASLIFFKSCTQDIPPEAIILIPVLSDKSLVCSILGP
jgi:hypothetical protein